MSTLYILDFGGMNPLLQGTQVWHESARFPSLESLLEGAVPEDAVILFCGMADLQSRDVGVLNALIRLRRTPQYYAAPVLLSESIGWIDAFFDGVAHSAEAVEAHARPICKRFESLRSVGYPEGPELRLLSFLYTRGKEYRLIPLMSPALPGLWLYPACLLLGEAPIGESDCLDYRVWQDAAAASNELLTIMDKQEMLVTDVLEDRYRICPSCRSSSLNYIDLCPSCQDLRFRKAKMYHCFTCGTVAEEKEFVKGVSLVCPRCNSLLRQIGVDYDVPLESYTCDHCKHRFIEPLVKAKCMSCGAYHNPDDLLVQNVFTYLLTKKGVQAVLSGQIVLQINLFDGPKNVIPEFFYSMIDWLLLLRQRYRQVDFVLIGLWLNSSAKLDEEIGAQSLVKMFVEISDRMKALLRATDLTMRGDGNVYWLLLPYTKLEGAETLRSRLIEQSKLISLPLNIPNPIQARTYVLPEEYADQTPIAKTVIANFTAEILGEMDV